eukprot:10744090-Alexandrium_andersonii.AAC.1
MCIRDRDCGLESANSRFRDLGPPQSTYSINVRWQIRVLRGRSLRMHPSGASGDKFEAAPGPAQFQ